MAENGALSTKQVAAIAALLASPSVRAAARRAKVPERTLARWLSEDVAFQAALKAAERQALDGAVRLLVGATGEAVEVLRAVMGNGKASPGARVRAAVALLTHAREWAAVDELERRIERLEALNGK